MNFQFSVFNLQLRSSLVLGVLCFVSCISAFAQKDIRPYMEKGTAYYNAGEFRNAAVTFKHAAQLNPESFDAWYNFGNALYKSEKYILASDAFQRALLLTSDTALQFKTLHNLGNAFLKTEDFREAIEFYKKALRLNPASNDTRYNISYALRMMYQPQLTQQNQNAQGNESKNASDFAKESKEKADALIREYRFADALALMEAALAKDETVNNYKEYIQKLAEIVDILGIRK
ncbi:MAG: tetratricopeptide repeat protein [Bacteroidales bacterium]|jgi:tetratricopeptide (TPR) repeat protein|nr:tetratricopeptide repeat protein [Bacteroidales bacterium]